MASKSSFQCRSFRRPNPRDSFGLTYAQAFTIATAMKTNADVIFDRAVYIKMGKMQVMPPVLDYVGRCLTDLFPFD